MIDDVCFMHISDIFYVFQSFSSKLAKFELQVIFHLNLTICKNNFLANNVLFHWRYGVGFASFNAKFQVLKYGQTILYRVLFYKTLRKVYAS
jgi:hypothetical protein